MAQTNAEPRPNSVVSRLDRRTVVWGFTVYFAALFMSVMPPFFQFVNRAEPFVFGLPFLLFWILFVSVLMSLGLIALYWVERARGEVV
jgi:hypothetical protein